MTLDESIYTDWWHSNHAFHAGDIKAAEHIYRRLRAEHSIELYYEIQLMNPTRFIHPLGTVLGRAEYARNLVVYQGVSVGSTVDHERPKFMGPCVLFPHSGVIGPVTVGSNVWITAGCIVEARPGNPLVIPDDVVVFNGSRGQYGQDRITPDWRPTQRSVLSTFFPDKPGRQPVTDAHPE